MIIKKKVIVGALNNILNYNISMNLYHLRKSFFNFTEENRYNVCASESDVLISCQYHYYTYCSTVCKHMFLIQRFLPALDIIQPTINADFDTVGSQLIELNPVEDGNNNNNNNKYIHIDTNNIHNELSSTLLELQNLLSVNITYENNNDYTAADTLNEAIINFKKICRYLIIKQSTESLPNNVNMRTRRN
ncbi:hypothetical protein BDF21DRAFT_393529 [Thamnidium elegans]|nr:hypothetical protein BDF21DRAFT_393529 [Thamnidium elegans]